MIQFSERKFIFFFTTCQLNLFVRKLERIIIAKIKIKKVSIRFDQMS